MLDLTNTRVEFSQHSATGAGTITRLLGYNPRRVFVSFHANLAGALFVWGKAPTTPLNGMAIPIDGTMQFKWQDCGPLVTGEWFVFELNAAEVGIIEVISEVDVARLFRQERRPPVRRQKLIIPYRR